MALNKLMHPRNPYKNKKPNFKDLALKYDKFRSNATTDVTGKVHLDFKNPSCLKALTWALLKDDFDLDVVLPEDRLIPTVPLRLNYILWLEDIIGEQDHIKGIDIGKINQEPVNSPHSELTTVKTLNGTGASCVYPLISAKKNDWSFIATEADEMNFNYATNNVRFNKLEEKIKVVKVEEDTVLDNVLDDTDSYTFCMCNPPFFGNQLEAWGMATSRSDDRPDPMSVSTASPSESIFPGGEVEFVKKMIADSLQLLHRVRVYSSMLGKKSSLYLIKEELKMHQIKNFGTTEFCQGRTMRWGIAWSFDSTVTFPKPPSKPDKAVKPLTFVMPSKEGEDYDVTSCFSKLTAIFNELQITYKVHKKFKKFAKLTATVKTNTWSNQRRKRRQKMICEIEEKKLKVDQAESTDTHGENPDNESKETSKSKDIVLIGENKDQCKSKNGATENKPSNDSDEAIKNTSEAETLIGGIAVDTACSRVSETAAVCNDASCPLADTESDTQFLLKFAAELQMGKSDVELKMTWIEGQNKEHLHQVLQYIKNKLKT